MKVCVLCHTTNTQTGTGEFASSLIKELEILMPGSTFTVMTSEDVLKLNYMSMIRNFLYIRKQIRGCDIIHTLDNYPYGVIAAFANFLINRPLIITAIGTGSLQLFDRKGWKSVLFRWAYSQADHVVAISHYVAKCIELNVKKIKVTVINPGIDNKYWSIATETEMDTKLERLSPYLLSVGDLKRRKGYEVMLPIISVVMKENKLVNYVIVADTKKNPEGKSKLDEIISELGISGRVIVLSNLPREDLRSVYQHALLYITLPQNVGGDIEGFGMSILQAASAGVPAIVGEGSGANDAVIDAKSGFLVSSNDSKDMLKKINNLLSDENLLRELSQGAMEFSAQMSWRDQSKKYVDIYKKIER